MKKTKYTIAVWLNIAEYPMLQCNVVNKNDTVSKYFITIKALPKY